MKIRTTFPAGLVFLACGVALAASHDPPSNAADQLARMLDLLESGGPAVIVLLGVLGIAFLAALIALVLVLVHLVRAVPRIARPLADAYATMRGGATQREEQLRTENAALARELGLLKTQVVGLEHRDEEKSRIIAALVDQLATLGVDVAALRATMAPRTDIELEHASIA